MIIEIRRPHTDTGGKAQGSQKGIAVESIDWRLHGKLVVQGMRHT